MSVTMEKLVVLLLGFLASGFGGAGALWLVMHVKGQTADTAQTT